MIPRNVIFLLFSALSILFFWDPLRELARLSLKSELYSHIALVPLISGYFLAARRETILAEAGTSVLPGALVAAAASILHLIGLSQGPGLGPNDRLSLAIFSFVLFWIGGFVFLYGTRAFKVGAFPLLFLFFMTPIPSAVIERFIFALQVASTEVTEVFFRVTGVPVLREGFVFQLPGLSIEVAKQCSGIRSSIALVLTSIIAGQLFLDSGWRRLVLVLAIFPVTVFKNGLRIVSLSLLGAYVDPRILGSELHKSGGIPFFVIGLALMVPVLWLLRRKKKD